MPMNNNVGTKRKLLAVSFFPAFFPPSSGGEQRCYYFYRHLSEYFDVTLLSMTYPSAKREEIAHLPNFRELRIPKPPETDQIHYQLSSEGIGPECSALAIALASRFGDTFSGELAAQAVNADLIIHDSPFTLPYDRNMGSDGVPRIYNAYNVEYQLAAQIFRGEIGVRATEFVHFLESELVAQASAVLAISKEEADTFVGEFSVPRERIINAPNGFEPDTYDAGRIERDDSVLFLGSGHPPNIQAVDFIIDVLAPALPEVTFNIVGSVCRAFQRVLPRNVRLLGFVDEQEKARLLLTCGAAINPLCAGAGTNLKMLDYLSHGAPVVTTSIGARGLPLTDGEHVFLAEYERFAEVLRATLGHRPLAEEVALRGQQEVIGTLSWAGIARHVANELHKLLHDHDELPRRRRVLTVCDYPVDRPMGGGQVRIAEMLRELGREFDVTLVCFTNEPASSTRAIADGVIQFAIPKSPAHLAQQASADNGFSISVADVVSGYHCGPGTAFYERFAMLSRHTDIILFEQCYLAGLLGAAPQGIPVVYSSQNVEYDLKRALYAGRADGNSWLDAVQQFESALLARSELTVCVSPSDAQRFRAIAPDEKTVVVENGIRLCPPGHRSYEARERLAVFLGSSHPPNIRAARFIIEVLAPSVPDITFALAGSVCTAVANCVLPGNVLLLGFLEVSEKAALLELADIAVNPLFDGGGSSLKVPDFFAAGLPVVSSAVGVRGYAALPGIHYVSADADSFVREVKDLMADPARRRFLSMQSRRFAEQELDWELLGGRMRRHLRSLLPRRKRPRVLVLTYRFGSPPRGGAETFLLRLLEQWKVQDEMDVDVASTRVGTIKDNLHFSAIYGAPEGAEIATLDVGTVHYFDVDEPVPQAMRLAKLLHAMWMRESLELGRRLAKRDDRPGLLGGWNHAERTSAGVVCWAGSRAQIRIPSGATKCTVWGTIPSGTLALAAMVAEQPLQEWKLSANFNVEFALPAGSNIVELVSSKTMDSSIDPRELAFLASSIEFQVGNAGLKVDLSASLELRAKEVDTAAWVADLVDVTEARDPLDDAIFVQIRGPQSRALDAWLDRELAGYDLLLVQGVPFATVPAGVRAARRQGVPCVALPHYHMEDRYYHWQSFYEAFSHADTVIAAPERSRKMFFDRIGAAAEVLPGGGLDPADFSDENIRAGRLAFQRLRNDGRPFVLVLGRKAGAKNYRMTIQAVELLRRHGRQLDLVMIGPDDDGLLLDDDGVCYYGSQPRDVVIGALAEAVCLVNMSDSESFGIVLLEAWMAGTPVIARASCVAFAELVEDGENGYLADDVSEIAERVTSYLLSPDLAAEHAKCGFALARSFSWATLANEVSELVHRLVR